MSSKQVKVHLEDILDCVTAISEHLGGITFEIYETDRKTRHAVERELQILTEAVFRPGDQAAVLSPNVDSRNLRGMGNIIRHEYDAIDDAILWDAIHHRLPGIAREVSDALARLPS